MQLRMETLPWTFDLLAIQVSVLYLHTMLNTCHIDDQAFIYIGFYLIFKVLKTAQDWNCWVNFTVHKYNLSYL